MALANVGTGEYLGNLGQSDTACVDGFPQLYAGLEQIGLTELQEHRRAAGRVASC